MENKSVKYNFHKSGVLHKDDHDKCIISTKKLVSKNGSANAKALKFLKIN